MVKLISELAVFRNLKESLRLRLVRRESILLEKRMTERKHLADLSKHQSLVFE